MGLTATKDEWEGGKKEMSVCKCCVWCGCDGIVCVKSLAGCSDAVDLLPQKKHRRKASVAVLSGGLLLKK